MKVSLDTPCISLIPCRPKGNEQDMHERSHPECGRVLFEGTPLFGGFKQRSLQRPGAATYCWSMKLPLLEVLKSRNHHFGGSKTRQAHVSELIWVPRVHSQPPPDFRRRFIAIFVFRAHCNMARDSELSAGLFIICHFFTSTTSILLFF